MGSRASVAIVDRGRILMVRQTYRGNQIWTFPGGAIEPEELPTQAAVREVKEEVGLDVEITDLIVQVPMDSTDGEYYCFAGRVVEGEAALGYDPEIAGDAQELCWFPLSDVKDHPEVARVLPALEEQVLNRRHPDAQ